MDYGHSKNEQQAVEEHQELLRLRAEVETLRPEVASLRLKDRTTREENSHLRSQADTLRAKVAMLEAEVDRKDHHVRLAVTRERDACLGYFKKLLVGRCWEEMREAAKKAATLAGQAPAGVLDPNAPVQSASEPSDEKATQAV